MKSDKMLSWIVIAITVFALVAIVVFVTKEPPQFKTENTPEAAVHNLILAIEKEDFQKAYEYVYTELEYGEFLEAMKIERINFRRTEALISDSYFVNDEIAIVTLDFSDGSSNFLGDGYTYSDSATVILDANDGKWKVQFLFKYLYMFEDPRFIRTPIE